MATRRSIIAAAAVASALALPAAAPAARTLSVTLVPAGAASVAQGAPFRFVARLSSDVATQKAVFFDVVSPDGGRVTATREIAIVPPGSTGEVLAQVTTSQYFGQRGRFKIVATVDGADMGELAFDVGAPAVTAPTFQDVSTPVGVATSLPQQTCGLWTSGAAWGDVNRDGRLDLFVTRMNEPAVLFVNKGATFSEEAAARGLDTRGLPALGAVFADYDNDGDADLFVYGDGPDRLYRNDGTGHFADVTGAVGIDDQWASTSASFADYDGDGRLDLYIVNHTRCNGDLSLRKLDYEPDHLYHQNPDGTFSDATSAVEHDPSTPLDGATNGAGFGAAWFDYDDDGRQDLFLANDYLGLHPDRNHLWHNVGGGQLVDVTDAANAGHAMNSMGVAIGDFDRDLRLDLAVSNWGSNLLLHNNGNGTFSDAAAATGAARRDQRALGPAVTWGIEFADFNLDGWDDLYVGAGFMPGYMTPPDIPQQNELFVNDRHGKFFDLSAASGADDAGQTRGVAIADYDRDGRVDIYVVNQAGPARLFRNTTPRGTGKAATHWLEVNTVGTRSNRDGCGTKLVLTLPGGVKMRRDVFCGSTSVGSGSSRIAHFGLGTAKRILAVEVRWPSGTTQRLTKKLQVDRLMTITEPKV